MPDKESIFSRSGNFGEVLKDLKKAADNEKTKQELPQKDNAKLGKEDEEINFESWLAKKTPKELLTGEIAKIRDGLPKNLIELPNQNEDLLLEVETMYPAGTVPFLGYKGKSKQNTPKVIELPKSSSYVERSPQTPNNVRSL